MNDDDLFGPTLSPCPTSSPLARGVAAAVVTVVLVGCSSNPGAPLGHDTGPRIVDAGIWASDAGVQDAGPAIADAGISVPPDAAPDASASP